MPVVDASFIASVFLADEHVAEADATSDRLAGLPLSVPPLFSHEIANTFLLAARRGRVTADQARFSLLQIEAMRLDLRMEGQKTAQLLEVGNAFGLTAYDAAYVSLALETGEPLATLDQPMRRAARAAGVALV